MLPEERDLSLLWDMLEAAKDVAAFIENVKFSDFENETYLLMSMAKCLHQGSGQLLKITFLSLSPK